MFKYSMKKGNFWEKFGKTFGLYTRCIFGWYEIRESWELLISYVVAERSGYSQGQLEQEGDG